MKRIEGYESPQMEVLELHTEGVLCSSDPRDGSTLYDCPDYNDGGLLDIF